MTKSKTQMRKRGGFGIQIFGFCLSFGFCHLDSNLEKYWKNEKTKTE